MEIFIPSVAASGDSCMPRRLEDKIRELCARSITASEDALEIIAELKVALREHVAGARNIVAATNFTNAKNRLQLERRANGHEPREVLAVPPRENSEKKRKSG